MRPTELIAPEETAGDPALPLTLLVRPGPLVALGVLALNDHVLKGSGWLPNWATGKLSDFAGLVFFPLLLVTLWALVAGPLERFTARRIPGGSPTLLGVAAACAATGAFFAAVQLSPAVADFYAKTLASLQVWNDASRVLVTRDATDLVALLSLPVAYALGRRAVGRMPPGRLVRARTAARGLDRTQDVCAALGLADVRVAAGRRAGDVEALARAFVRGADDGEVNAALEVLRR